MLWLFSVVALFVPGICRGTNLYQMARTRRAMTLPAGFRAITLPPGARAMRLLARVKSFAAWHKLCHANLAAIPTMTARVGHGATARDPPVEAGNSVIASRRSVPRAPAPKTESPLLYPRS